MSQTRRVLGGIRTSAAPALKSAMLRSGLFSAIRSLAPSRRLAILRYHAICGPEGHAYASPGICVTPGAFEEHVKFLVEHYRVLSLPEATAALARGQTLPPNAVAITFDDGYADNYPAAQVLARHGATATFYLTAGALHGGQPFWLAETRVLLERLHVSELVLDAHGQAVTMPCATAAERQAASRRLSRLFKSQPIPIREALRDQLRAQVTSSDLPKIMLTWDEVAAMHRMGMTIGAHTMTHANLPSAGSEARTEIASSRAVLEERIGAPVTMFSYPNGGAERYITPEIRQMVIDAGFAAATTSTNGFAGPASDLFLLERVQVAERLEDLAFSLEVERFAFAPRREA